MKHEINFWYTVETTADKYEGYIFVRKFCAVLNFGDIKIIKDFLIISSHLPQKVVFGNIHIIGKLFAPSVLPCTLNLIPCFRVKFNIWGHKLVEMFYNFCFLRIPHLKLLSHKTAFLFKMISLSRCSRLFYNRHRGDMNLFTKPATKLLYDQ